jgi:pyridoxal 5'-phosphate synthase pdxT subunit
MQEDIGEVPIFLSESTKPLGVLALQGDFSAHITALESRYGKKAIEIRTPDALDSISGLIIPGGESSTLLKLLDKNFKTEIIRIVSGGMPLLATCAGAILISKKVLAPEQESLSLIDIIIERNSYGRQTESFIEEALALAPGYPEIPELSTEGIFIRAPKVISWGDDVTPVLMHGETPVLLKKDNIVIATFHPELSEKKHLAYELFLSLLPAYQRSTAN